MEKFNAEHIANLLEVEIGFSDGKFTKIEVSVIKEALALINSQEQRVKELTEENERLKARVLEENNLRHQVEAMLANGMGVVRANTVREMQERSHEQFHDRVAYTRSYVHDTIDQIAKEMLEDAE